MSGVTFNCVCFRPVVRNAVNVAKMTDAALASTLLAVSPVSWSLTSLLSFSLSVGSVSLTPKLQIQFLGIRPDKE